MVISTNTLQFKYKVLKIENTVFLSDQLNRLEQLLNENWSILTETILPSGTIIYVLVHIK